jgi:hypothetical protein
MILHSFSVGTQVGQPGAGLVLSSNTLYGTSVRGGASDHGTVFGLWLGPLPQLTITRSGTNVILTWPTNMEGFSYAGYTLQFTTNLSTAAWSTNLPAPVVVNGFYTVTNPISGTHKFYQLSQ